MSVRATPVAVLGREKIDELWGEGWTIAPVRPHPDPYHIPPEIIPRDRSYQWVSREHDYEFYKTTNWRDVPAERHPGVFAPWGYEGPCIIGDLILVEKPKLEVEETKAANIDKALRQGAEFLAKSGFSGGATVMQETSGGIQSVEQVDAEDGSASVTNFPPDLISQYSAILRERDRLVAEEHKAHLALQDDNVKNRIDPEPFNLLACRVRCMEQAIKNIREKLAAEPKETGDGDSKHAD